MHGKHSIMAWERMHGTRNQDPAEGAIFLNEHTIDTKISNYTHTCMMWGQERRASQGRLWQETQPRSPRRRCWHTLAGGISSL
jgi:hypothetical protein